MSRSIELSELDQTAGQKVKTSLFSHLRRAERSSRFAGSRTGAATSSATGQLTPAHAAK